MVMGKLSSLRLLANEPNLPMEKGLYSLIAIASRSFKAKIEKIKNSAISPI